MLKVWLILLLSPEENEFSGKVWDILCVIIQATAKKEGKGLIKPKEYLPG